MKYGKTYLIYQQLMGFYHSDRAILSKEEIKVKMAIYQQLREMFHGGRLRHHLSEKERKEKARNFKYKYKYGNFSNTAKAMTDLQKEILCREKLGREKQ
jgi:hypothetical protein